MTQNIFQKQNGQYLRVLPTVGIGPTMSGATYSSNLRTLTPTPTPTPTNNERVIPPTPTQNNIPIETTPTTPITQPTQPQKTNPYDAFNLLLQDALKTAQKLDPTDLLAQQRELQRLSIEKSQGTGVDTPTEDELKFLSPSQQEQMRNADISSIDPAIDETAYQIQRINQDRKNLIEQIQFARESGDLARTRALDEEYKKKDEEYRQATLAETKRSNLVSERISQQNANTSRKEKETTTIDAQKESEALSTMNQIEILLNTPELANIMGPVNQYLGGNFGGPAATAKNQFEQVKNMLTLNNRAKLKGQGAVSDFEGKMIEKAASALGRNLSYEEGKKQLIQIKGAIATSNGLTATVKITNPTTGESQVGETNSTGIANAIKAGNYVEYQ